MSGNTVRKKGAVSSPDCYVFESPRLVCINMSGKNGEANEKKCDYYMKACGERKKRTEQEEKRRGAQTQKNNFLSFRARGRQGVKCIE